MQLDVLKDWTRWMFGWLMLFFIVGVAMGFLPFGRDDTDGEWPHRSGMSPMTDARTGCQYLRTADGGITPRLDGNGRQIGCR